MPTFECVAHNLPNLTNVSPIISNFLRYLAWSIPSLSNKPYLVAYTPNSLIHKESIYYNVPMVGNT
jgi:hypothetical protein